jgi:hypothetical protein
MTLDEFRFAIPEYLGGNLGARETSEFEEMLKSSPEARIELAELRAVWDELGELAEEHPSAALRARFYQKLNALNKPKRVWSWKSAWPQLATGVTLFVLGILVGGYRPASDAAKMNSQLQSLRETVALSLLDRQSATSRLEGIEWSNQVASPDAELRTALVRTLNQDPNVNVRLASLDALEKFSNDSQVRRELVASISTQDSPLVQIALIDAVVHMHDHDAAQQLRKVTADADMNAAVRQRAQWGLQKLGL